MDKAIAEITSSIKGRIKHITNKSTRSFHLKNRINLMNSKTKIKTGFLFLKDQISSIDKKIVFFISFLKWRHGCKYENKIIIFNRGKAQNQFSFSLRHQMQQCKHLIKYIIEI